MASPPKCELRREAAAFLGTVGLGDLKAKLTGGKGDRCYCEECYKASWPDTIQSDGPTPYVIPRGWFRFATSLDAAAFGTPHQERVPGFDQKEIFDNWSVSFHGVKDLDVLRGILEAGRLLKPGDTLPDGSILRSTKCAGRQDKVIYTSPTVKYAGLKFYAAPQPYGDDGMAASMVFMLRQKPDSFVTQGETMAFEKARPGTEPWLGHLAVECPHVALNTIEWKSEQNQFAVPYGLLIRPMKIASEAITRQYRCPLDKTQVWRVREIQAHRPEVAMQQAAGVSAFLVEGMPESRRE